MAASDFSERRDADALQGAWERYERLLAAGADPEYAAEQASKLLTPGAASLFAIADAVRVSARPVPSPAFAARMEADLMSSYEDVRRLQPRRGLLSRTRRTAGSTMMAFAACIALLAGVLLASSHSLPGDGLYGLKRSSEEAQLAIVWGPSEAHVRISLAQRRLDEVQGLFARTRTSVLGAPGSNVAGGLDDIDPHIAQLIRETLAQAEQQITIAANILIGQHVVGRADASALARLVTVAHHGAAIAKGVAVTLPSPDKPPVLTTADNLAIVAAKAEAVQQQQQAAPAQATATPCPSPSATPTPSPTPSPSPTSTPEGASPAASASAKPSSTPAATPERADPCARPTPTPTPTPSATPAPASPAGKKKSAESSPGPQSDGGSATQAGSGDASSAPSGAQPAS